MGTLIGSDLPDYEGSRGRFRIMSEEISDTFTVAFGRYEDQKAMWEALL